MTIIGSLSVFRFDFTLWSTAEMIGVLHFSWQPSSMRPLCGLYDLLAQLRVTATYLLAKDRNGSLVAPPVAIFES
jgi:hypothetical protein